MRRLSILHAVIGLLLAAGMTTRVADTQVRVVLMQRIERSDGIHLVYYVESTEQPRITVTRGSIGGITSVQDPATLQWRTTVAARLDRCIGTLTIDGQTTTRQRCIYLPQGATP